MSLKTKSKWFYGFYFDNSNKYFDIDEGSGEQTISIVGDYSAEDFKTKLQDTLNQLLTLTYSVTFSRTTRLFTISASGQFSLLVDTGINKSQSMFSILGYTEDKINVTTVDSDEPAGFEYAPQFYLQKYISFENYEESVTSTVNLSADGSQVEVIDYGTQNFMECDITLVNDGLSINCEIDYDLTGVANLRSFLTYCRKKRKVEFMPDRDTPTAYVKCILEKTAGNQTGTGFKLSEMYAKGAVGYFESGKITFRKVG